METNWISIGSVVIGFILLLIALIIWLAQDKSEWYTWVIFAAGIVLLILGIILWFWKGKDDKETKAE